jgi:hypothetical protein
MTLLFTIIAISVHIIFLFKREILFQKKSYIILLAISFILGIISFVIKNSDAKIKSIEMLQIPFWALIIFFIMNKIYNIIYGQDSKESFWTNDIKLMKDGVFNFLFWVLGLIIPVFLMS